MKRLHWLALPCLLTLSSCAVDSGSGESIAQLRNVQADLSDIKVEGGSDKAMESYRRFLEQTPEGAMTPEAMRRLADLKIQQEYGTLEGATRNEQRRALAESRPVEVAAAPIEMEQPKPATKPQLAGTPSKHDLKHDPKGDRKDKGKGKDKGKDQAKGKAQGKGPASESEQAFEARTTQATSIKPASPQQAIATPDGATAEVQGNAGEAIKLYRKLLDKYPHYARNDQVLYQLSRAYDEVGMTDEANKVMTRIAKEFPSSRYHDEIQFRLGEYYFMRKKFLDAEDAFNSIVTRGPASSYYELGLYKLGWTFYKQELYEDSLHRFVALLDHKIDTGYDFEHPKDPLEHKRIEDTYQVISLAFSNLGGSDAAMAYFNKYGKRSYEAEVYGNLAEYYLDKRRYSDAAVTYKAFVKQNPYHKVSPLYDTRVIDIYKKGGFPKLVIEANKEFVVSYGLKSKYWEHFDVKQHPEVIGYVKNSLKELANHYHALYQEKKFEKDKPENFQEAMRWYREFLASFPKEAESPGMHYQMAELLLENKNLDLAAVEFEHTAYDYPAHEKASEAGYAAVYAYRKHLENAGGPEKEKTRNEIIRSSLKFAETFQKHEKAALVMSAALEDIYTVKNYALGVRSGRKLLALFPQAEQKYRRTAWLVVAHSSFELGNYADAEEGYQNVLPMTAADDKERKNLVENYAASIYKQGEQAGQKGDHKTAATHFLRVATAAPTSSIRPNADYDGAAALMQLKDWGRAAEVLRAFRSNYAGHTLQPEVTKKLAYIYREDGKPTLAAAEYERIESESKDPAVRSAALQLAGDLYAEGKDLDKALAVYRRHLSYFPKPLDLALENRFKIAKILKERNDTAAYMSELKQIVSADADGGGERTDRTRYLGASSLLILTEPVYEEFAAIKLVAPFEQNLAKKKTGLKAVKDKLDNILRYEIAETTAAATYYLAEMYYNFNRSLVESERPGDLVGEEKEQYELALEDQAYPFEEKAIEVHQQNTDFVALGIFNSWVDKSFGRLAKLVPARYAKFEESAGYIMSFDRFVAYAELVEPMPPVVDFAKPAAVQPPVTAEATPAAGEAPQVEASPPAAAEQPAPAPEQATPATVAPAVPPAPTQAQAKPASSKTRVANAPASTKVKRK